LFRPGNIMPVDQLIKQARVKPCLCLSARSFASS
jgi:hypothetical protein